VSVQILTV